MIQDLVEKIVEKKSKRVLIQLPEGLKTKSQEILELLSKRGIEAVVSLDPCYGACDLRDWEAERLECDLLVNVGHSDFGLKTKVPTLYYEWRIYIDPIPVLEKNFKTLEPCKNIGLISSVNFIHLLEKIEKYLENKGKKTFVSKGERIKYPGQILGCDLGAGLKIEKKIDCFLFVGSGIFHPLGLALKTDKPIFVLDLEKKELRKLDSEKFKKQMYVAVSLAEDAEKFGILVSTKPGQSNYPLARKIKKQLEEKDKKVYIFSMDEFSPDKLIGIDLDAFVNTACPRIAIEDRTRYKKPIVNLDELFQKL